MMEKSTLWGIVNGADPIFERREVDVVKDRRWQVGRHWEKEMPDLAERETHVAAVADMVNE